MSSREEAGGSPRFTNVRRSDSVSKYLEEYSEKRLERSNVELTDGGGCFWSRSCALILAHQVWIGRGVEMQELGCEGELIVNKDRVEACCTIMVVELRGDKGMVKRFWKPEQPSTVVELESNGMEETHNKQEEWGLVAMAGCGKIRKITL